MECSFPVINMEKLQGEEREKAMELLRDACENWGFFEVCSVSFPYENVLMSSSLLMLAASIGFAPVAAQPWHLTRADGRGGEADQRALQEKQGAKVQRVREQGAGERIQVGGQRHGLHGLGEHLLPAPSPRLQHVRVAGHGRRLPVLIRKLSQHCYRSYHAP
ncbi:hypothetical protein B296_00038636 [Ensete ventricosum]|uniref:Non-haem dioxygenase N-terminal domain-containing protein n=1 Tax=Ensete ventricosum TaxID=4639 RepID=A0A426Z4S4_ENSVE|nr:hypothetical protein B296_00038636 [Ensete ventricosum]